MLTVANKEAKKRCKVVWTKEVLEVYGEHLQRLIEEDAQATKLLQESYNHCK